jgi:hypothetical protein
MSVKTLRPGDGIMYVCFDRVNLKRDRFEFLKKTKPSEQPQPQRIQPIAITKKTTTTKGKGNVLLSADHILKNPSVNSSTLIF